MGLYTRIPERERILIPEEQRCEISYNGFHAWEIIKKDLTTEPIFVCNKCGKVKPINWAGAVEKKKDVEDVNDNIKHPYGVAKGVDKSR